MFSQFEKDYFSTPLRAEDPEDRRLAHDFLTLSLEELAQSGDKPDFVLLGYPDDRGVLGNYGRAGANLGPNSFRKEFYKMAQHQPDRKIVDLGDLNIKETQYAHQAHELGQIALKKIRGQAKIISIGGGHDWALSDYMDFCTIADNKKRLLVNIDAHLDMRPDAKEESRREHSGTPYRSLVENNSNNTHFLCFGLQEYCNQKSHLDWAHSKGAEYFYWNQDPAMLIQRMQEYEEIAFSVCLDAFPAAYAPGVSAPQALGVDPNMIHKIISEYKSKIKHLGIYELNPTFDIDNRTAKLAATFAYAFI